MLYQKKGYPEESEIVLCTVTKIQHGSVFVRLDDYGGKSGIINISEISPGRIRNIRDFVNEGKKSICKVLRVDEQRGHIDLSLRRVTESQRRAKNEMIKREQKAEKLLELVANEMKKPIAEIYGGIMEGSKYGSLYSCLEDVSQGNFSLDKLLDKKIADKITELAKLKIRPPEVIVEGNISLVSYAPDGVELVKEALRKAQAPNVILKYLGGGKYRITVKSEDYKNAEAVLEKSTKSAIESIKSKGGAGSFERKEVAE